MSKHLRAWFAYPDLRPPRLLLGGRRWIRKEIGGCKRTAFDGIAVLPLFDLRAKFTQNGKRRQRRVRIHLSKMRKPHCLVRFSWWEEVDSNHRSRRQQIYSLLPLATRESSHGAGERNRTINLLITNQLLCLLSYTSVCAVRRPTAGAVRRSHRLVLWCLGADLNHRHRDFQSLALPTELPRHAV